MNYSTGEIWVAELNPAVANEQGGIRPVLIVSTDRYHAMPIGHAIVVPITTTNRGLPHHVSVADDGGLRRESWAMSEAVRAISVRRFGRRVGKATPDTVTAVQDWLGRFFGDRSAD